MVWERCSHLSIEKEVGLLAESLALAYGLEVLIVEVKPGALSPRAREVVPAGELAVVHGQAKQFVMDGAAQLLRHRLQAVLPHVQAVWVGRHFLNFAEHLVESLDVEHQNFGQLDDAVGDAGFRRLAALLTRVEVIDHLLIVLVEEALLEGGLVLERLGHEGPAGEGLILALAALHHCLHDAREDAVNRRPVAHLVLRAYLLYRFFGVRAIEVGPARQCLLVLQLL